MGIVRRIFVSVPNNKALTGSQFKFKWALINRIQESGFIPEIFYNTHPDPRSLTAGKNWSFDECKAIMKRCVGTIIIGLPRHILPTTQGVLRLPSEYAHFEGALSISLNLPTFLLAENELSDRGIFHWGSGPTITTFPIDANAEWLLSDKFILSFDIFLKQLKLRRDIFLGYCSTSEDVAQNIKLYLEKEIEVTVLDWQKDFIAGRTIIEEIEEASKRTSGGVFLFTKDDKLENQTELAAPRDNVIFETGFFASAKGRERVLIIREPGAKMPADLGGNIYETLSNRDNIKPLEERLRNFIGKSI